MGVSDIIAIFINDVLEREKGCAELHRSELASRFNCVPSQINYVISTRFSPEQGYIVESRRGGNGYIRIRRAHMDCGQVVMHAVNSIGDKIDAGSSRAFLSNLVNCGAVCETSAPLFTAALSDNALRCLPLQQRDNVRASIFKHMLVSTVVAG